MSVAAATVDTVTEASTGFASGWLVEKARAMYKAIDTLVEDVSSFRYNDNIPTPNSCAVCGWEQRSHGNVASKRRDGSIYAHLYEAPSDALRLARMKARAA